MLLLYGIIAHLLFLSRHAPALYPFRPVRHCQLSAAIGVAVPVGHAWQGADDAWPGAGGHIAELADYVGRIRTACIIPLLAAASLYRLACGSLSAALFRTGHFQPPSCLLYTSDAADE